MITSESDNDVEIPTKDYTFSQLLMAQAMADLESFSDRDLPFMRIHLKNRKSGIARIISDLEKN